MQLHLDRDGRQPLYMQIVAQIQDRIRGGALPAGTRLPPIRELARDLGLTRLTVHNSYAELQADGWIESFVGRGSFVAERPGARGQLRPSPVLPPRPLLRLGSMGEIMQLAHQPDMISFAQAAAAPETFPVRDFNRALQQVVAERGAALFDYGATQGEEPVRQQLARWLLDRNVVATPEQIVVVGGAQQGIDVALRALTEPGDTILVEEPTYLGMVERMQMQGLRLVAVPIDEHGIRPEALETAVAMHQPRLLYTIPTFHNPTGVSMSEQRREAVLDLARRNELPILEDDIYGHLSYDDPAPSPLAASDTSGLVVYLSSFSKVLMPGLRFGLLVARPPLLDALVGIKRLADLHSPQLIQHAMAAYLERGQFAAHIRETRTLYLKRRDAMIASLRRHFPPGARFNVPAGGLCVWVELPAGVRSAELYHDAIAQGVVFAPGAAFFPERPAKDFVRLSFAALAPDTIERGIAVLGGLLAEQLGRPVVVPSYLQGVPMV